MIKRLISGIMCMGMFVNTIAHAEDYWSKANSNIETGIGAGDDGEIQLGNIEDYIKNGWTSEIATPKVEEEAYVSPYQNEIDLVVSLGIMPEIAEETSLQEKLSYYEYAESLKNLTKYSSIDISKLQSVENIVTCEKVLKDFVTILGYDYFIGNGKSYIALADEYGITKGIQLKSAEAITKEQFAKVVANILEIDMLTVKIGDTVTYEIAEDNTLLSQMKVEEIKGWVNANEHSNMYNPTPAGDGKIQIDAVEYLTGNSGAENYIGRYVTAYVKEDDNEEKTVIKIDVNKKDNFFEVSDDDISKIDKSGMTYYPLDLKGNQLTSKNVKFDMDGIVIYNGKIKGTIESVNNSMLLPGNGIVKLADTDFNGSYDILFIWDFDVYVADAVSGTRVLMKNNKGLIDFDPDQREILFYMDGVLSDVNDVSEWTVLSVAKSEDNMLWTVYASNKNIYGTYKSKDEDKFVLGDGNKIPVDESFFGNVTFGEEYRFYLSWFGKIVAVEDTSKENATATGTGKNYGYLRKCYLDEADEEAASFRIFRISNSSWVTLKGAEKISFYDGTMEKNGIVEKQKMNPAKVAEKLSESQLIVYETDIYNNITEIQTAVDYTTTGDVNNDVFARNKHIGEDDSVRKYYGGYFGGYYLSGKFIMLRVPQNRDEEKNYALESATSDGYIYGPLDIYDVNEDMILNGIIVRYTSVSNDVTNYSPVVIIDRIEATEHNEETVYKITAIDNKEYYLRMDENSGLDSVTKKADGSAMYQIRNASDLKKGDMFAASIDEQNYIKGFRVELRLSEITKVDYFAYATGDKPPLLSHTYGVVVRNAEGSHVIVNTTGVLSDKTKNKLCDVSGTIRLYDTKTGKFEKISKADILPGDKIINTAMYYYMRAQTVVIK